MAYSAAERERLFSRVISELQNGTPLRQVLDDIEMPSRPSFYSWIDQDPEMAERYLRAKKIAADALYDEMLAIANTPMAGETTTVDKDGVKIVTADMLGHRRLLIDTIKWRLAKEAPKKFGDKLDVTTAGDKVGQVTIFQLPDNGRD
jgi:hypothetical protein